MKVFLDIGRSWVHSPYMKATAYPTTTTPLAKLIKSSLYWVNGKVARYVGDSTPMDAKTAYGFRHHADHFTAQQSAIGRATTEQIHAYLGK